MNRNYTKYRVVYHKSKYLCANRRLTDDVDKARVFSSALEAYNFASLDIDSGVAEIYSYAPGKIRQLVQPWGC